ncbi:MAG TPA: DUF1326 domain-containing protein [Thermoleophilaceae bacterium]|nr:DUF1326 domain-containing protein [Thermoleophilaceae bacterium]
MATVDTAVQTEPAASGYQFQGTLLEACNCDVLCPCWIGEDPDNGTCQSVVAYHFDNGTIRGVDVSGMTVASIVFIPGNILAGNWKQVLFIDDRATEEQAQAMADAFTGKLGGPLADLAQLVGERLDVVRTPISHEIVEGRGTLTLGGDKATATMEPYRGPDGSVTTLHNSIFSTVPGSPAWVGKAERFAVNMPEYGWTYEFEGRNAIQSDWVIDYRGEAA